MKYKFMLTILLALCCSLHYINPIRSGGGRGGGARGGGFHGGLRGGARYTPHGFMRQPSFRPITKTRGLISRPPIQRGPPLQRVPSIQRMPQRISPFVTPRRQAIKPIFGGITRTQPATTGIIRGTVGRAAPQRPSARPPISAFRPQPSLAERGRAARGIRTSKRWPNRRRPFFRRKRWRHRPFWYSWYYPIFGYPYYPDYDIYSPFTDATNIVNPEVLGINPAEYPYYTDRPTPEYTVEPTPPFFPFPEEPPFEEEEVPEEAPEVSTTIIEVQPQMPVAQPGEEPPTADAQDLLNALLNEELKDVHRLP